MCIYISLIDFKLPLWKSYQPPTPNAPNLLAKWIIKPINTLQNSSVFFESFNWAFDSIKYFNKIIYIYIIYV